MTSLDSIPIRFKAGIKNEYSFLSNFYPFVTNAGDVNLPRPAYSSFLFELDGKRWHSVEQWYQYRKYLIIDEEYAHDQILTAKTAPEVKKRAGKGVYVAYFHENQSPRVTKASINKRFDEKIQEFVNNHALCVMRVGLHNKFDQNPELREALDKTWPRPLSEIGRMKRDFWSDRGENMLGKMLVQIRGLASPITPAPPGDVQAE